MQKVSIRSFKRNFFQGTSEKCFEYIFLDVSFASKENHFEWGEELFLYK